MMFSWEESHGHYVACLSSDAPKHFLHHECLPQLDIALSASSYCSIPYSVTPVVRNKGPLNGCCCKFGADLVQSLSS